MTLSADIPTHVLRTTATLVRVPTGTLYTSVGVFTILVTSSMTGFRFVHSSATPAHCLPIANTATFLRWETAVVLGVPEGEGGAAAQAGVLPRCASVPAHVVVLLVTFPLLLPVHQLEKEEQ